MKQHWAINGRFLAQPMTGVQRYAREIVSSLDRLIAADPDLSRHVEVELLLPPDAKQELDLSVIGSRVVGKVRGHLWEQLSLPAHVKGGLLSLCNTGPLVAPKQIVCIHDANTRNFPQSYSRQFRLAYRLLLPALGRTSSRVATVSRFSAGELDRHGIAKADKIFVAPNGHEHALAWKPAHSFKTKRAAGLDTIVLLGSAAPHKNAQLIIGMAGRLRRAGFRIAVAGMTSPRVFNNPELGEAANVLWLGRLSDEELAALLRDSLCLAFPSFTEGFGLPPLEAMALGCPVVSSDRASLPEVCGDAALYAAPDDPEAWFNRLNELRDGSRRRDLIARTRTRATLFRWEASASLYLKAMLELDGVEALPEATSAHATLA